MKHTITFTSGNGGKVELTTQDLRGGRDPKSCFLLIFIIVLIKFPD